MLRRWNGDLMSGAVVGGEPVTTKRKEVVVTWVLPDIR